MSKYLDKKFEKAFKDGCQLWTSEDGMLISVAIMLRDDWREKLQANFSHLFEAEKFDEARGKIRYAYQEWCGAEFFDNRAEGSQRRGKLWRIGDEKTGFAVIDYELQIPR